MKSIFLLLIISLFFNSLSQEQNKSVHFGLSIFPNISNGFANEIEIDSEFYKGIRSSRFSYSLGSLLNINFENRLTISTGINFFSTGDKSLVFPPDPLRGFINQRFYKQIENFIELPLNLHKKLNNSFIIKIGGGVLYNVQHKSIAFFSPEKGTKLNISTYENTKLGITANIGFGYQIDLKNEKLIEIIPYAQYNFLSPLNTYFLADGSPKRKYGSLGIQFNYFFKT